MTRIRAGVPIDVGGIRVVPIERLHVDGTECSSGLVVMATKEPIALLIESGGTLRALDIDGREIPISEILPYVENPSNGIA